MVEGGLLQNHRFVAQRREVSLPAFEGRGDLRRMELKRDPYAMSSRPREAGFIPGGIVPPRVALPITTLHPQDGLHRIVIGRIPSAFMGVIDDRLKGREFPRMQNPVYSGSLPGADPAAESGFILALLRIRLSEGIEDGDLVSFTSGDQFRIGLTVLGGIEVTGDDERDPLRHEFLRAFPDQSGRLQSGRPTSMIKMGVHEHELGAVVFGIAQLNP